MPDVEQSVENFLQEGRDLLQRVETLLDLLRDEPFNTGERKDIEDCIGREGQEAFERCQIRRRMQKLLTRFEYRRFWRGSTDSVDVTITLYWSYDGCNLYDVFWQEADNARTSDWIIRPKVQISNLQEKKRGECPCCPAGGKCVLIRISVEAEYEAAWWPNPTVKDDLLTARLCAADGRLQRL